MNTLRVREKHTGELGSFIDFVTLGGFTHVRYRLDNGILRYEPIQSIEFVDVVPNEVQP